MYVIFDNVYYKDPLCPLGTLLAHSQGVPHFPTNFSRKMGEDGLGWASGCGFFWEIHIRWNLIDISFGKFQDNDIRLFAVDP